MINSKYTKMISSFAVCSTLVLLTACGGGSGGLGTDFDGVPEVAPSPNPAPEYSPEPTPIPTDETPPIDMPNGDMEADPETTAPWTTQGSTTVTIDSTTVYSGKKSLLVSNRTLAWHAPLYPLTGKLADNTEYEFKAYVRMSSPASATINFTAKVGDGDNVSYIGLGSVEAADDGWTEISGRLVTKGITEETPVSVYFESPVADASFYVDELSGNSQLR